jgi:hypothetical protein
VNILENKSRLHPKTLFLWVIILNSSLNIYLFRLFSYICNTCVYLFIGVYTKIKSYYAWYICWPYYEGLSRLLLIDLLHRSTSFLLTDVSYRMYILLTYMLPWGGFLFFFFAVLNSAAKNILVAYFGRLEYSQYSHRVGVGKLLYILDF